MSNLNVQEALSNITRLRQEVNSGPTEERLQEIDAEMEHHRAMLESAVASQRPVRVPPRRPAARPPLTMVPPRTHVAPSTAAAPKRPGLWKGGKAGVARAAPRPKQSTVVGATEDKGKGKGKATVSSKRRRRGGKGGKAPDEAPSQDEVAGAASPSSPADSPASSSHVAGPVATAAGPAQPQEAHVDMLYLISSIKAKGEFIHSAAGRLVKQCQALESLLCQEFGIDPVAGAADPGQVQEGGHRSDPAASASSDPYMNIAVSVSEVVDIDD